MKATLLLATVCAALAAGCKTQSTTPATVPSHQTTQPHQAGGAALPVEPPETGATPGTTLPPATEVSSNVFVIHAPDGSCEITIDTTAAPDLSDWASRKLAPVLAAWYPKISALLPTPGYKPPKKWNVVIAPGDGVAATGGTRVTANATWLREEIGKQAVGALVHEEVHVVQQYGGGRRNFTPGNFSLGDISNMVSLVKKIEDKSNPVSEFVAKQLTPEESESLANFKGPGPTAYEARTNLVAALNKIVRGTNIYNVALFTNVTLQDTTKTLLDQKPEGDDVARLNRALLEDAFPGELARRPANAGRRRGGRNNTGWLTEGIPDYIRWFLYEPKSHGADVSYIVGRMERGERSGQPYAPKYTDSYRISANFLNYVTIKYDRNIVTKLNDALRQGKYYDDIWADNTGKTVDELGQEWVTMLRTEADKRKPTALPKPGGI